MKIIKIIVAVIATLCLVYYVYFQTPSTKIMIPAQDFLIVGTSADYPPYSQIDLETGEIVGFEIDVITQIGQSLHKKIVLKDMPFSSLIIELMSGQIDIIAAGMSPSPERAKAVLFSIPYINNDDLVVISKKENPTIADITDLYTKTVAVNTGYTSDTFLSKFPKISLVRLKSPADGMMALQANSVDAFVTSKSNFHIFLKQQSQDHNYQFFNLPSSADNCALAYEKNNSKLQQQINPIIQNMIEDGTIERLKKKWGLA